MTVIAESSAGCFPGTWDQYKQPGNRMTNGHLAAIRQEGQIALIFVDRQVGPLFTVESEDILRITKRGSMLNAVVEIETRHSGIMCFVAPRGRMKKIFEGVGHPLA